VNDYNNTELTSNQSVMNINASNSSQNLSTSFPEFHYDEQLMNLLTEWKLDLIYPPSGRASGVYTASLGKTVLFNYTYR
jgi:hypothetical protein